jgi:hypothetical protein
MCIELRSIVFQNYLYERFLGKNLNRNEKTDKYKRLNKCLIYSRSSHKVIINEMIETLKGT